MTKKQTISNQTGIKDINLLSRNAADSEKREKISCSEEEKETLCFVPVGVSACLRVPVRRACTFMESQVCETAELMSSNFLVVSELQSQMFSRIPIQVNTSSHLIKAKFCL